MRSRLGVVVVFLVALALGRLAVRHRERLHLGGRPCPHGGSPGHRAAPEPEPEPAGSESGA